MRLLIVTLGLLTATASNAQTTIYNGANGMPSGRVERFGSTSHYYGADGSYQGSSERRGNQQKFYGSDGTYQGEAQHFGRW